MEKKVLIIAPYHDILIQNLLKAGYQCDAHIGISKKDVLRIITPYEGIVTSNKLAIDREIIDAAINLRWVGRMGSGMEIIDTEYAKTKNIQCFSSPEGNANAVAEQALGMLISLNHKIVKAHMEMNKGIWQREANRGEELYGKTAGILGYGCNGSAFARILAALGVEVLVYDKYKKNITDPHVTICDTLQPIYEKADIISFHVPLSADTLWYFNEKFLNQMHNQFTLLNLSRGKVASLETVYKGMISGKIKSAALDVWESEPVDKLGKNSKTIYTKLMNMPNFIGTPHIGGYTQEAKFKMSSFLSNKIVNFYEESAAFK